MKKVTEVEKQFSVETECKKLLYVTCRKQMVVITILYIKYCNDHKDCDRQAQTSESALFVVLLAYRNDPKFSDSQVLANSVDLDRSSLIRVYSVCHSVFIFWTHYFVVKQPCSNFRVITANFSGVQIFTIFTVHPP